MIKRFDLTEQTWHLTGWTPDLWRMKNTMEIGMNPASEIKSLECSVPCSVQKVLLDNNIIKDWNIGFNYREIEWIENRHWIYSTNISNSLVSKDKKYVLRCEGLDYKGEVYVNTELVYKFENAYITHDIDITEYLVEKDNLVTIVFLCPPRFLGQFGYTSKILDLKPRYYYTWDWTCRVVQTAIWEKVYLLISDDASIDWISVDANAEPNRHTGILDIKGYLTDKVKGNVSVELSDGNNIIKSESINIDSKEFSINWDELKVDLWYPNGLGDTKLYELLITVSDDKGNILDEDIKKVGFKNITWHQCEGAKLDADTWICAVNGNKVFLQGIDWVPIKQTFADVTLADYKEIISLYKEIGINFIRVWGGAVLEKEDFYNVCDELGLMVWQEFPQSSSGLDNYPPEDKDFIEKMVGVATCYIKKRKHHASLIMWCGGNELFREEDGIAIPCSTKHPLLGAMGKVVKELDPNRRYIPASPTGPRVWNDPKENGMGLHENTHGPWKAETIEEWNSIFDNDDSMFRAETGAPGSSGLDILEDFAGNLSAYPIIGENDYWSRPMNWWIETDTFKNERGRYPTTKEEYVAWSQKRQATLLVKAVSSCKNRFPRCGGFIIWMGHDNYPCPANTSIIDYYRRLKPAAEALKEVLKVNNSF